MLGDVKEAALSAGIPAQIAYVEGLKILGDKTVARLLKKGRKRSSSEAEVLRGLRRLAFGRTNDALELLKDDPGDVDPQALDLYNVSEIKRVKGGGVEIKFFDRLEALERLGEIETKESDAERADAVFRGLARASAEE